MTCGRAVRHLALAGVLSDAHGQPLMPRLALMPMSVNSAWVTCGQPSSCLGRCMTERDAEERECRSPKYWAAWGSIRSIRARRRSRRCVSIKLLDAEGDPQWSFRTTNALNLEELLGALVVQAEILKRKLTNLRDAEE